ncbi:hypothetical protein ACFWJT_32000 [Streptomyces sp. NPDC127069]|uniref:hypothetical protein n=1 Tax=Streptomyces sp. NPDC127069 TaxID=3347128 RepID=UPI003647B794
MNPTSLWAQHFADAAHAAIPEPEILHAGRTELDDQGVEHLRITPGRLFGIMPARGKGSEVHAAILLPVLTAEQATALRTASPDCAHTHAPAHTLPECLAHPAHTGGITVVPQTADLRFLCTCPAGTSPCRHTAALVHVLTDHLITHPQSLAVLRGLSTSQAEDLPPAGARSGTEPKTRISAHHTWAWHRDFPDPAPVPRYCPAATRNTPATPAWSCPPPPAAPAEQLHALVRDAAAQVGAFLHQGTPLECRWQEDAVRLTAAIPHTRIPDVAERLGIDIADLRRRTTTTEPAGQRP